ncbi:septum formation initiator family protein [Haloimpatiens sp. FM7315]|uniref:septum formation initiator family protein n=1 Tax=Haloimpatiens sp. FM7315 TaxID=3298609 RepID=UPI003977CE6D
MMDKNSIRGNTVLKPSKNNETSDESYKELLKKQKELLHKNRKKVLMKKMKIIRNIGVTFLVAMLLLVRFAVICNLKQNVANTEKNITKISKENENLKVELLKYDNIQYIEKIAAKKLNMEKATLNNALYCNLEKNHVTKEIENKNKPKKNSVMQYLISKLF